ncbi:MAG: branched-chain amino acid ABC transporter permease, partial [Solirubrobacteraceae bacterium]
MSASEIVQQFVNALSLGSTFALLALGLAVLFSIMGLINFAHGDLLTIGGYTMWYCAEHDISWLLMIPITIVVTTIVAVLMERIAFRPLRGAGVVTLLLTSFAVGFFIENLLSIGISARPKGIPLPDWVDHAVAVGSVTVPVIQLVTIAVVFICLVLLAAMLRRTTIGISMRAAADDFDAVRIVGVRAHRVVTAAFAISGLLAGVASLLYFARSGSVTPTSGFNPIVMAFIAVVIGGLGSLQGAVAGGFLLGFVQVGLQASLPDGVLPFTDAFALMLVIAILLVRPNGLFGRRVEVAT